MNRSLMTFIISLVVLGGMFTLMGTHVLEATVAMTLVGTVVGYWIRDAQETLIPVKQVEPTVSLPLPPTTPPA